MNFQEFRRELSNWDALIPIHVYAWRPEFDKNNLSRWIGKGYLVKLRNGFYAFPE